MIETITLANGQDVQAEIVNGSEIVIGDSIISAEGAVVRVTAAVIVSLPLDDFGHSTQVLRVA